MACVGGSQITITLTWQQGTTVQAAYIVTMDETDCTIPYTVNPAIVTTAIDTTPAYHISYASVTNVVFGTPGQIGKVNLRVKVTGNAPSDNLPDNISGAAIAIVRTA